MQEPDDIKIESEVENSERSEEFEDPERSEGEEEKAENKIAKMREELNACRKDKQEYMDGWQRAKADYVNALKRFETDTKTAELRGKVKAVETLLPAFDALERAKEHGEIPEGFMAIAKQIESAFATLGLEEAGKVGEQFDPAIHEAFGQDKVDSEGEEGIITEILEKGWRINGTVIRPARVRVGHYS
ncbi:MAG: nucleotide exchange factor GrpE [Candidatus Paceibacterota bacterium]|jgi:molecular chaperone GrpE